MTPTAQLTRSTPPSPRLLRLTYPIKQPRAAVTRLRQPDPRRENGRVGLEGMPFPRSEGRDTTSQRVGDRYDLITVADDQPVPTARRCDVVAQEILLVLDTSTGDRQVAVAEQEQLPVSRGRTPPGQEVDDTQGAVRRSSRKASSARIGTAPRASDTASKPANLHRLRHRPGAHAR